MEDKSKKAGKPVKPEVEHAEGLSVPQSSELKALELNRARSEDEEARYQELLKKVHQPAK